MYEIRTEYKMKRIANLHEKLLNLKNEHNWNPAIMITITSDKKWIGEISGVSRDYYRFADTWNELYQKLKEAIKEEKGNRRIENG